MVNKWFLNIPCVFLLALTNACQRDTVLSSSELTRYVENQENGFVFEKQFGDLAFKLKLEPIDYKVVKDLTSQEIVINQKNYSEYKNKVSDYTYFIFRIETVNGNKSPLMSVVKNAEDRAKLSQFMQTGMQHLFYIENSGKKIPSSLYFPEGDYGVLNYNAFSLAFDNKQFDSTSDLVFVFDDQIFNHGLIKFTIDKNILQHPPTLKIS